ncbi:DHA2 family efflux MFS transporter permease subunit [Nocardia brasiliensis]
MNETGQCVPATHRRWAIALASVASFMVGLDVLVMMTAVSTLHEEFAAGAVGLAWTVNAYEIGFAALILTGSSLGDRFGRRLWFVIGIGVFTLGSACCALSTSIETLVAARAFQGLGGGIALALALAVITSVTPAEARGAAFGWWGAVMGVAVTVGPLIGGAIIHLTSWQWCFWVNIPIGLAVIALSLVKLDETTGTAERVDFPGVVLSTAGVVLLAQALLRGGEIGWTAPPVEIGIVAGIALLAAFIVWQRRSPTPMMPLTLFRNRSFTGGCGVSFVLGATLYGSVFLVAQYLQLALGSDPLTVGFQLLPLVALAPVVAPIAGQLADRSGERPLVIGALVLISGGFLTLAMTVEADTRYRTIVPALIVAGVGIATLFPVLAASVMRSIDISRLGIASGVSNTLRQVGAVFGMALAVVVFTRYGSYRSPEEYVAGFTPAVTTLALAALLGLIPAIAIRPHSKASAAWAAPDTSG